MQDGLALFGAGGLASAATAEHASEEVADVGAATAALSEAVLAVLVVELALFGIAECLVSQVELLELFLVATSVGMVLKGELPESFLDLVTACSFLDAQEVVELLVIDFLFGTASSTAATHFFKSPEWESTASKEHVF